MTDKEIKAELANALEVVPDEIMDFVKTGTNPDRYTVILFSFKKYTNVEPKKEEFIPAALRYAYNRPERAKKAQLVELAPLLGLDLDEESTVKELVEAIKEVKNGPTDAETEEPA